MINTKAVVERALAQLQAGKMIILTDDADRENEGDLVLAAEKVTPAAITFMARQACGLICLSLTAEQIDRLQLPMMTTHNASRLNTAFTVSIEANDCEGSGISAVDRAHTIRVAASENAKPGEVISPGHIFPLRAREGGVLVRNGHTEGSVDLMRLAGLAPAAVICEILQEDGQMARGESLTAFAEKHALPIVSIQELIAYRFMHETLVTEVASARLPIEGLGEFHMKVFKSAYDTLEHVALIKLPFDNNAPVFVRIHSECLTGDVFGSARCDCGTQRDEALARIARDGGVFLYMRQEGRGVGLANKIKAYALQEVGMDTVEANRHLGLPIDARCYGVCAQILKQLNISKIRLLTNNPKKIAEMALYGLEEVQRESLEITPSEHNVAYLQAKKVKLGHLLEK